MQAVRFRVSSLWLAIDVLAVEGVVRCPEGLEETRATRDVVGLLPFHGTRVPLVELAPWLDLSAYYPGEERHVVVVNLVRVLLGLLVGEVEGVVDIEAEPVLPAQGGGGRALPLLRAAQTPGGLVHLVEPEVFFRREDIGVFLQARDRDAKKPDTADQR